MVRGKCLIPAGKKGSRWADGGYVNDCLTKCLSQQLWAPGWAVPWEQQLVGHTLTGSFQPRRLFPGQGSSQDKGLGWPEGAGLGGCRVAHRLAGMGMWERACSVGSRAVFAPCHAEGSQHGCGPWDRAVCQSLGTARGRHVQAAKAQQEPVLRSPCRCPPRLAPPPLTPQGAPQGPVAQQHRGGRDNWGSIGCSCTEGWGSCGGGRPSKHSWGCRTSSCPVGSGGIELVASPGTSPLGATMEPGASPRSPHSPPLRAPQALPVSGTWLSGKGRFSSPRLAAKKARNWQQVKGCSSNLYSQGEHNEQRYHQPG